MHLTLQATTTIVEKTVRAFYSNIAVVCCVEHRYSIYLHRRLIAVIEYLKLCHIEQKFVNLWVGSLNHQLKNIHLSAYCIQQEQVIIENIHCKHLVHLIFENKIRLS